MKLRTAKRRIRADLLPSVFAVVACALLLISASPLVGRATAQGFNAANGINYLHVYSVTSTGAIKSEHLYPGSDDSDANGGITVQAAVNRSTTGASLQTVWLLYNGTQYVFLGFQLNGSTYTMIVRMLLTMGNSSYYEAAATATYYRTSGTAPVKIGDIYGTNFTSASGVSSVLTAFKAALTTTAGNYSHSSNSTIQGWGTEELALASGFTTMSSLLSGNATSMSIGSTMLWAYAIRDPTVLRPIGEGAVSYNGAGCVAAAINLAIIVAEMVILGAACAAAPEGIWDCYWFVLLMTVALPAAIFACMQNC